MIETEVGAHKGVDTLGRWLSHYLAEQLNEAKKDPSKQNKCVDLILKLWRHREFYQHRPRPLEEYNNIINILERLDPQKDETFYFTNYQEKESQEENSTWLSLALEIDQIARALISFCLAQGVKDAELSKDPWLEAVKDLGSDQQIILLNRLSKLEEDYSQEYLPKRIGNRVVRLKEIVSQLESFINLNERESQTTEHLKDE